MNWHRLLQRIQHVGVRLGFVRLDRVRPDVQAWFPRQFLRQQNRQISPKCNPKQYQRFRNSWFRRLVLIGLSSAIAMSWLCDRVPMAQAHDLPTAQVRQLLETRSCVNCDLTKADLHQADLRGVDLRGANLERSNLYMANLEGANLEGANLFRSYLGYANFQFANLRRAEVARTKMFYTRLTDADLESASLYYSWIEATDLSRANLRNANLTGVRFVSTDLRFAQLCGATMPNRILYIEDCDQDLLIEANQEEDD
jgi:uncharacterized protein YjbI with pentapeptide repeats